MKVGWDCSNVIETGTDVCVRCVHKMCQWRHVYKATISERTTDNSSTGVRIPTLLPSVYWMIINCFSAARNENDQKIIIRRRKTDRQR